MSYAIEFTGIKEIKAVDLPDSATPGPGEALVRTHRMGICGTDLSCYLGKFPFFAFPRTPGHELGLEVVSVGEGVANVKAGDKCSLEPYVNDPSTVASQRGKSNACPNVQVIGVHKSGGLRKSNWIVPAHKLHPGNDLSYDELALVETLAIGFHAVKRGNPQPGETVMVIGAGPIGLACLEFLKLMDLKVIVVDFAQNRLDFCREKLGIKNTVQAKPDGSHLAEIESLTEGAFCDVIIDATGHAGSMVQCYQYAAVGGRVVYVGITAQDITFPQAPISTVANSASSRAGTLSPPTSPKSSISSGPKKSTLTIGSPTVSTSTKSPKDSINSPTQNSVPSKLSSPSTTDPFLPFSTHESPPLEFCTPSQYLEFFRQCPSLGRMIVNNGVTQSSKCQPGLHGKIVRHPDQG